MIILNDISKKYEYAGGETLALDGIALTLGKCGLVCVLGESGCGKTTLLNIIGGLDRPTSGDVVVFGRSLRDMTVSQLDEYRGRHIGYVFQRGELIREYTAKENVALACRIAGFSDSDERAERALQAVGLSADGKKKSGELSGGQLQRAAIARAIAKDPEIVLADEPTGSLDPESGDGIVRLLKELSRTRLVIMVTHNRDFAEKYADRLIVIGSGKIVSDSGKCGGADACEENRGGGAPAAFAFSLGLKNTVARKGRSFLLSVLCAIGVFCVAAVFAFMGGAESFIRSFERSTLGSYPILAGEGAYDITELIGSGYTPDISRLGDDVYVRTYLSEMYFRVTDSVPITEEYLEYAESLDDGLYTHIYRDYRLNFDDHIFTAVTIGSTTLNVSFGYIADYADKISVSSGVMSVLPQVFSPLPDSEEYVLSGCELVYGEYPDSADEMILVVDEDYGIDEYILSLLGYYSTAEVDAYFSGDFENARYEWSYEDLVGKEFAFFNNDTVYRESGGKFFVNDSFSRSVMPLSGMSPSDGISLKITGVLRRADESAIGCGLYYNTALDEYFLDQAAESEIVNYIREQYDLRGVYVDPFTGDALPEKQGLAALRGAGGCDLPGGLRIYASSVEAKQSILAHLEKWNVGHDGERVQYADNITAVAGYAEDVVAMVSGILLGVACLVAAASVLSLAAVTALSAKERKREFGLLGCLGMGRGKVLAMLLTECAVTGLAGGLIGVIAVYAALTAAAFISGFAIVPAILAPWLSAITAIAAAAVSCLAGIPFVTAAVNRSPAAALSA